MPRHAVWLPTFSESSNFSHVLIMETSCCVSILQGNSPRAQVVTDMLVEMNPDVQGEAVVQVRDGDESLPMCAIVMRVSPCAR